MSPINSVLLRNASFQIPSISERNRMAAHRAPLLRLSETLWERKNNYSHIELGPQNDKVTVSAPTKQNKNHLFNEQSVLWRESVWTLLEAGAKLWHWAENNRQRELDYLSSIFRWGLKNNFQIKTITSMTVLLLLLLFSHLPSAIISLYVLTW